MQLSLSVVSVGHNHEIAGKIFPVLSDCKQQNIIEGITTCFYQIFKCPTTIFVTKTVIYRMSAFLFAGIMIFVFLLRTFPPKTQLFEYEKCKDTHFLHNKSRSQQKSYFFHRFLVLFLLRRKIVVDFLLCTRNSIVQMCIGNTCT